MANELSVSVSMALVKGDLAWARNISDSITVTGSTLQHNVQAIGFAASETLSIHGDLGTAGYAIFRNLDATNFVQIGPEAAGDIVPLVKLKAGECAVMRVGTSTIRAQADSGAVNLEYAIIAD